MENLKKANLAKARYNRMVLVLGLKGLATIILYWKFTHGDIGVVTLVTSCVVALLLVKLDHSTKKGKNHSRTRQIELEVLGLLLIIAPLFLLDIDNWNGGLHELLKMESIRFGLIDVFLTIIISRLLWHMRN